MTQNEPQEYRAKVINMGGTLRGWIPTRIVTILKARGGDYLVFRKNVSGKVVVSARRATASEKKTSVKRAVKNKLHR